MAKLTDDPKVAEAIAKAEERGSKAERKRVAAIVSSAKTAAGDLEDRGQKKAVKDALTDVAAQIREG